MRKVKVRVRVRTLLGQNILLNQRPKVQKATNPQPKVMQRDVPSPSVIVGFRRTVVLLEVAAFMRMMLQGRYGLVVVQVGTISNGNRSGKER